MGEHLSRRALVRDAVILAGVSFAYLFARYLTIPDAATAAANGSSVLALERAVHLDLENGAQLVAGAIPGLLGLLQAYYLLAQLGVVLGVLAAVAWWRPQHWGYARDLLIVFTVAAFFLHWAYPLAPPRLTPDAAVTDTLADGGTDGLRQGVLNRWFNPFAAFPSTHTGMALMAAAVLARAFAGASWVKWVWLHPALMAFTVLATGNHWVIDIVGAAAIVAPAAALLGRPATTTPAPLPQEEAGA